MIPFLNELKGRSEGAFIRVLYNYLLQNSPDFLRDDKDHREFLSREALRLHKEYWKLFMGE